MLVATVRIVTSASLFHDELVKWLNAKHEKLSKDIVEGVPVEVYKERCAEARAYREMLKQIPEIMKKAKD